MPWLVSLLAVLIPSLVWGGITINKPRATLDVPSFDEVVGTGRVATTATSVANSIKACNASTNQCVCLYSDPTDGPKTVACDQDGNLLSVDNQPTIPENQTYCLYDDEADQCVITVNPDANALGDGLITIAHNDVYVQDGWLKGKVEVSLDTAASVTLTAADCGRTAKFNNDADVIDYTLPPLEAGCAICFMGEAAGVITVDTNNTADVIVLYGTALAAGNAIDSPGNRGDSICLLAKDSATWTTWRGEGTWVDGGAD